MTPFEFGVFVKSAVDEDEAPQPAKKKKPAKASGGGYLPYALGGLAVAAPAALVTARIGAKVMRSLHRRAEAEKTKGS